MGRLNKGVVKQGDGGRWYGRVRWTDEATKKPREKKFPAQRTKREADKLVTNFKSDLEEYGSRFVDAEKITFAHVANVYQEEKLIPAKFRNDKKIKGLKSYADQRVNLKTLTDYFGNRTLRSIKHFDLESFKQTRLETKTRYGKHREYSSVHRELALLKVVFNFARTQGWITREQSPFERGAPLISKGDENTRDRTLSRDEEKRLLAACHGRRAHLLPLVIAALDTGSRRGELFKLKWKDVDLDSRTFTVLATNSKTARARTIPMTTRVQNELTRLWETSPKNLNDSVFGYDNPYSTVKTAFRSALKEAEITDFRWHDLRHTAITRMVETKSPSAIIMKISGHTQHNTFARYVNPNTEAILNVADALGASHANSEREFEAAELIN
jgi:integrase